MLSVENWIDSCIRAYFNDGVCMTPLNIPSGNENKPDMLYLTLSLKIEIDNFLDFVQGYNFRKLDNILL
jgi:hypothetical protein